MQINAIGTNSASQPLGSMAITRREPGPDDVQIAIDYCGVCHWMYTRPAPSGQGRSIPACRAMKSSAG